MRSPSVFGPMRGPGTSVRSGDRDDPAVLRRGEDVAVAGSLHDGPFEVADRRCGFVEPPRQRDLVWSGHFQAERLGPARPACPRRRHYVRSWSSRNSRRSVSSHRTICRRVVVALGQASDRLVDHMEDSRRHANDLTVSGRGRRPAAAATTAAPRGDTAGSRSWRTPMPFADPVRADIDTDAAGRVLLRAADRVVAAPAAISRQARPAFGPAAVAPMAAVT